LIGLIIRFPGRLRGRPIAKRFLREFRRIPADRAATGPITFWRGASDAAGLVYGERFQHEVILQGAFDLACYPVTNALYELFDPGHADKRDKCSRDDRCPVVYVDWFDAWAFCRWLGAEYRLPTDAEWEFACRVSKSADPSDSTPWYFGDEPMSLNHYGWNINNSEKRTHPVGRLLPNAWGLFDMHGNVQEWTDSSFQWDPRETTGAEDTMAALRFIRGGSWSDSPPWCRSASEEDLPPKYQSLVVGFRVARALHEKL
jgi:formylglycine-generating enzyme required for sulfatase activity